MEKTQKPSALKIAITGPESSGKTFLAKGLSVIYDQPWLPEYARTYLTIQETPGYTKEQLDHIAHTQLHLEKEYLERAETLLFCDTDAVVLKIWYEHKFGIVPDFVLEALDTSSYEHHLLLKPDIEYEDDPLRENPENGDYFFDQFQKTLSFYQLPYTIIEGDDRIKKARIVVDQLLQTRAF